MPILILTHGYPASGKTTFAEAWQAEDPAGRVLMCRDDIRREFDVTPGDFKGESKVTAIHGERTEKAVDAGLDIIVANTNLVLRDAVRNARYAHDNGYDIEVREFRVDQEELLRRNASRTGVARVPDEVMERMFTNHPYSNWWTRQALMDRLSRPQVVVMPSSR